jgi:hypothetical protein
MMLLLLLLLLQTMAPNKRSPITPHTLQMHDAHAKCT